MFRLSRILSVLAVFILSVLFTNTESHAWRVLATTHELFAVGTAKETGRSYLYKINPLTAELTLLGDTGHNHCTGLDFNPEGKLKATCETRDENGVESKTNAVAGTPVVLELDSDDGFPEWAIPHGISNLISDITIADDGTLFSYENLKDDEFHRHLEVDDFFAQLIGNPGIESFDLGLAAWGDAELKIAANTGTPSLYSIDSETAEVKLIGTLNFPSDFMLDTMQNISTREGGTYGEIASMDAIKLDGAFMATAISTSATAVEYAFAEGDADFVVLLTLSDELVPSGANTRETVAGVWAAIALLDVETLSIDYVVEMEDFLPVLEPLSEREDLSVNYIVDPNLGLIELNAIAVRRVPTRNVPTLSTTGIVVTGAALLIIGLVFYRRKYGLSFKN